MVKISNCKIVKCLIKLTRFQGMKQQCVENWSDCRGSKALKWPGNVESFGRRKGKCINALYPTLATALPRKEMKSSNFQRWEGRNRCHHYSLLHVRHICLFFLASLLCCPFPLSWANSAATNRGQNEPDNSQQRDKGASQGVATCCHTVTAELNLWGQRGQPHWIMLGWHQHKTSPFSQRSQKHLFCWNPIIQKKFVLLKSYKSYNPIICSFVRNIYKYIVSKFGIAKLSLTM